MVAQMYTYFLYSDSFGDSTTQFVASVSPDDTAHLCRLHIEKELFSTCFRLNRGHRLPYLPHHRERVDLGLRQNRSVHQTGQLGHGPIHRSNLPHAILHVHLSLAIQCQAVEFNIPDLLRVSLKFVRHGFLELFL